MQRRGFITLFAGVVMGWPLGVRGQQAARIYRVASAWVATEPTVRPLEQAFLAVLTERGYVVGRNLLYESRYANGEPTRLLALVDELIAFRPDVLAGIEPVVQVMMSDAIICAGVRPPGCPVQAGRSNLVPRSSENISLRYIAFQSSAKIRCASDLITFTSDCPSVRRRAAHTKKSPER
ncbi:MAG: hypothetical protein E6G79_24810 [Alphaproteobacteria bacterium]|nr:MAG: hypothetical protein E6G79_24810 [Alphaproteobacteria bacterium]